MSSEGIVFEGIVIGFENLDNYGEALYVTGRVDGYECFFYLITPKNIFEEYVLKGIGRLISGFGLVISREPLIIQYTNGDT